MPTQASNIFEASAVPHLVMEEPGYEVCVGCIADAGQKSFPLLFENRIAVPFFTVMVAGENPLSVYETEVSTTFVSTDGAASDSGTVFVVIAEGESVSGATSCFCLSMNAKIAHTTTRITIIHAIIFCMKFVNHYFFIFNISTE